MWSTLMALCLPALASGQAWITGDNATVAGCVAACGSDYSCLAASARYMDEALIAQLRQYATAQVARDQWFYRHVGDNTNGQNATEIAAAIRNGLVAQMIDDDVISQASVESIAASIARMVTGYSDELIGFPPQYQCPLPCDYRNLMYIILFSISAAVNIACLIFVVPYVQRVLKMSRETSKSLKDGAAISGSDPLPYPAK